MEAATFAQSFAAPLLPRCGHARAIGRLFLVMVDSGPRQDADHLTVAPPLGC